MKPQNTIDSFFDIFIASAMKCRELPALKNAKIGSQLSKPKNVNLRGAFYKHSSISTDTYKRVLTF